MTEKEKAQAGLLYKSTEEELKSELMRCKNLCAEYNRLMPSQSEERKALLKKILGKTGENFWIEQSFWCDYGYNIEIGENFYSNHNLVILALLFQQVHRLFGLGAMGFFYQAVGLDATFVQTDNLEGASAADGHQVGRDVLVT